MAGGKDVQITVRQTVHGPILSDVVAGRGPAPAPPRRSRASPTAAGTTCRSPGPGCGRGARPTRSSPSTRPRASRSSRPRRATSRCRRRTSSTPTSTATSATRRPGQVPIRPSATPGAPPGYWPAPGWKSRYDWKGFVPFAQMPTTYDPPEGFIVAANQAVSASTDAVPHHRVGLRLPQPAHPRPASRRRPRSRPARMSQIQMDNRNGFAPTLVKELLRIKTDPYTQDAQKLLRTGTSPSRPASPTRRPRRPTTTRCGPSCST